MQLREYQIKLIQEVSKSWRTGYKKPCVVLPCGGGKSVITADMAKRTTDNEKRVLFVVHRKELCQQIEETFRNYGVNMDLCMVAMVQTISRRLAKIPEPKLIITDENHHCIANTYRKIYETFPEAYCVGVTATPVRLNGGGLGDVNDKLIIGVSAKWLIENKFLAPYDYYAPALIDCAKIKTKKGDFDSSQVEDIMLENAVFGDVIKYYRKLSDNKKAVCYCPTVKYSKAMAEQFRNAGIPSEHIDGSTDKKERERIISDFRNGKILILCNVDLISEGFDVPDCNTAILLRPTKSLTLYIQQSMRCMRYKENKRAVIIDHVGNVHRFGLPDTDREWSLESTTKKKKSAETEIKVRQCTECFYTHAPAPVCPKCGHRYAEEKKREEIGEKQDIELQKITEKVGLMKSPDECSTMKELCIFGKNHGYKNGWAYHQAKRLGIWR